MLPLIVILPEIVTVPVESDKIQSRSSLPLLLIEIDAADKKPSPTAIVVFIVPPVVGPVIVIAPPTTNVPGEAIVNVLVLFSVLLIIKLAQTAPATEKSVTEVKDDESIFDIGDKSAEQLAEIIKNAKTVLWNGPVGVFEFPNFRKGTEIISHAIANSDAFSIAGGGDTLAAIDLFGIADKISYISTGGGAFLEFVEGKVLPAVEILEKRANG